MNNIAQIDKFWGLQSAGMSAALDISPRGELICRFTISNNDERAEGRGTPPQAYEGHARIIACKEGELRYDRSSGMP